MATKDEIEAFYATVKKNDLRLIEQALETAPELISTIDPNMYRTALHIAASMGHIAIVQRLLEKNPTKDFIDAQDIMGNTALHYAAMNGHLAVAEILVNANADRAKLNREQHTASEVSQSEIMKQLLDETDHYFKEKNINQFIAKPSRIKVGFLAGSGLLSAGATAAGITALALTLAGVAFLPFAAIAIIIGAAVLTGVGLVGLSVTAFAAYRYRANRASAAETANIELDDFAAHSEKNQFIGLGGNVSDPSVKKGQLNLPLVKPTLLLASADDEKKEPEKSSSFLSYLGFGSKRN